MLQGGDIDGMNGRGGYSSRSNSLVVLEAPLTVF